MFGEKQEAPGVTLFKEDEVTGEDALRVLRELAKQRAAGELPEAEFIARKAELLTRI